MKNGKYLAKNSNRQEHLHTEERAKIRARQSRKEKQRQRLLVCIGALIVLLIIAVIIVILLPDSLLEGKWDMDGVTAYEFYKSGKGALVLPSAEYEFTYTVKDNTLYIDFEFDGAKDAQYVFSVEGNTLTLDGGNATTQGIYVLTKSE